MTREEAKKHFWCDTNEFGESVAKRFGSINYSKIFTGYYIGSEIDNFIDKIYDDFEEREIFLTTKNTLCDGCKHHLSQDGKYPLEPCGECERFYADMYEKKGVK